MSLVDSRVTWGHGSGGGSFVMNEHYESDGDVDQTKLYDSYTIDAREFAMLDRLSRWTHPDDLLAAPGCGEGPEDVRARLNALVEARLIEVSSDPAVPAHAAPMNAVLYRTS